MSLAILTFFYLVQSTASEIFFRQKFPISKKVKLIIFFSSFKFLIIMKFTHFLNFIFQIESNRIFN